MTHEDQWLPGSGGIGGNGRGQLQRRCSEVTTAVTDAWVRARVKTYLIISRVTYIVTLYRMSLI